MTDYAKVSELEAAVSVAATDLLEISQDQGGGAFLSKKVTKANAFSGYLTGVSGDAAPSLGGNLTINEKSVVFVSSMTDDSTASGDIVGDIQAAASIAFPDLVYLNTSGQWEKVDANAVATCRGMIGLVLESKTTNQAVKVLLRGFARYDTWNWATIGAPIFASTTPGALSQALVSGEDDVVLMIGTATHAHRIYFNPQPVTVEYKV